jgi:hypothetical protein
VALLVQQRQEHLQLQPVRLLVRVGGLLVSNRQQRQQQFLGLESQSAKATATCQLSWLTHSQAAWLCSQQNQ